MGRISKGYVYIHKLGNGEYEAVGYSWDGYIITAPVYDRNRKKAYMKIYNKLTHNESTK